MELQWPLILFTFFLAWSAGTFATQAWYAMHNKAPKSQMPAWIVSIATLVVGGIAVFLHLQHWERIFNGFGHITSGITQELIAIVLIAIVMVIYFVYLRRTGDEAKVPSWVCVLAIILAAVLCIVMAHSYLMPSRPAWDNFTWILAIIGGACVMGPATMAIIAAVKGKSQDIDGQLVFIGSIVNAVCVFAYTIYLATISSSFAQVEYHFDLTHPTHALQNAPNALTGDSAVILWLGAILIGAIAPIVCALLGKKKADWKVWGGLCLVCAIIGAICVRVVFYINGQTVFMFY